MLAGNITAAFSIYLYNNLLMTLSLTQQQVAYLKDTWNSLVEKDVEELTTTYQKKKVRDNAKKFIETAIRSVEKSGEPQQGTT